MDANVDGIRKGRRVVCRQTTGGHSGTSYVQPDETADGVRFVDENLRAESDLDIGHNLGKYSIDRGGGKGEDFGHISVR